MEYDLSAINLHFSWCAPWQFKQCFKLTFSQYLNDLFIHHSCLSYGVCLPITHIISNSFMFGGKSVNCWQIFINRTHLLFRVSVYGYVYMCNQNHNKRCTVADSDSNKQLTNIWLNSLHAKFFRGNINMYLHFMSLLHIDMTQVAEILPHVRQGPTYST